MNDNHFFRANRQYIVSLKSIRKISNYGLQRLKVDILPQAMEEILISKLKAGQFKMWLNR